MNNDTSGQSNFKSVLNSDTEDVQDDFLDFNPFDYPDLSNPIYLVPQPDNQTVQAFTTDTAQDLQVTLPEPPRFQFAELLDFRYFCDKPPVPLDDYWVVFPALRYRNLRVDPRRRRSQTFPIYLSKLPAF